MAGATRGGWLNRRTSQVSGMKLREEAPGQQEAFGVGQVLAPKHQWGLPGEALPWCIPARRGAARGTAPLHITIPRARHRDIAQAQGHCPGVLPGQGVLVGQTTAEPLLGAHAQSTQGAGSHGQSSKQSPDPDGGQSPAPRPLFPPHIRKDTGAGAAPSRGERCRRMASSRAAGPDRFPSCSMVAEEAGALSPQPALTNAAEEEQGPVGVCSLCLGRTCASSRACSERPQKRCRQPRAGRVCGWEGLPAPGTLAGKAQRMLLHIPPASLPVFFPFSASSYRAARISSALRGEKRLAHSGTDHSRGRHGYSLISCL